MRSATWQCTTRSPLQSPDFDKDPGNALAKAYDLVLNGVELGGGSIRIHDAEVQSRLFRTLGISDEEAEEKFGFLLKAFKFGPPPLGGIAFGLDRMIWLLAGADSIRDVIAFPKTQKATCLLTEAPSSVDPRQLRELHIASTVVKRKKWNKLQVERPPLSLKERHFVLR